MESGELLKDMQYIPLRKCRIHGVSAFIEKEIDPFLSIPLAKKLTVPCIEDYAQKLISLADGYALACEENIYGIAAAYIRNRMEKDRVYLSLFGVAQCVRRHGIGSELLRKLISELPKPCTLYTHVDDKNTAAWEVYKKAGFHSGIVLNGRRNIFLYQADADVQGEHDGKII